MGIGKEYFKKKNKTNARKKLGLDLNRKYLLYIGWVRDNKGIRELINAVKDLDVKLLIIGGGDLDKYKEYVYQEDIKNIKFLGAIYDKRKFLYLDSADALVLPSYTEGAPVVIMEAMAKNVPVIATDVGGINKMVKNNKHGILIKPKSEKDIKNAVCNVLKWKHKNLRKDAEQYKWKNIIKKTLKDYKILLNNRKNKNIKC